MAAPGSLYCGHHRDCATPAFEGPGILDAVETQRTAQDRTHAMVSDEVDRLLDERDFYYAKLTKIEAIVDAGPDAPWKGRLRAVLYAPEE